MVACGGVGGVGIVDGEAIAPGVVAVAAVRVACLPACGGGGSSDRPCGWLPQQHPPECSRSPLRILETSQRMGAEMFPIINP